MASTAEYVPVLAEYPDDCQPLRSEYLGSAGGFSGARFWRLTTQRGTLCLRRWPASYPTVDRLQFIQAVLWHVQREGFGLVPVPLEAHSHAGYIHHDGALWELSPWMPGEADFLRTPSETRLIAALMALAEFHRAAASFPLPSDDPAPSPGINERLQRFRQLRSGHLQQLRASIQPGNWPQLADRALRLIQGFEYAADKIAPVLENAARLKAISQPCIRDVWHDHVLFRGFEVSGLIDFGSMRPDTVACDVARLLGSLVADDARLWQLGLEAYESRRPLTSDERRLVTAFDQSAVLMGGLQWLEWIYRQRRAFEAREVVEERLDVNLRRLAHLAE